MQHAIQHNSSTQTSVMHTNHTGRSAAMYSKVIAMYQQGYSAPTIYRALNGAVAIASIEDICINHAMDS